MLGNPDKISIIIPMYNVELYIERTIQSLLSQSYPHVEIILVDDKSTDRTYEKALNYAERHENILLLAQPENRGVSTARNTGLKHANGEYITFVDPDDILGKHALEIMHEVAVTNDADLILGVYKNFNRRKTSLPSLYQQQKSLTTKGQVFTFTNPEIFNNLFCWGKMYRRDLLNGVSFPEHVSYTEDQPFSIYTYLHAKKICIAPSVVYFYRMREIESNSLTQGALANPIANLQNIFDSFEAGRKFVRDYFGQEDHYVMLIYLNRVVQGSIRYVFEGSIKQSDPELRKKVIIQLISWVAGLEDFLVYGANSFRNLFVSRGQEYINYLDSETQVIYLEFVRLIRNKMLQFSKAQEQKTFAVNGILETVLDVLDEFFASEADDLKPAVCYPKVSFINAALDRAVVGFVLAEKGNESQYELAMEKVGEEWIIQDTQLVGTSVYQAPVVETAKPKILLTYREFSGCNTLALYKSIPEKMKELFDVDIVSGNKMTVEYVRKVLESDIIVTSNMEYAFGKYLYNPRKVVVDLWHGVPLKKMFYKDPGYHDKNAVETYWSQTSYAASYSDLYSEIVNSCIRINPNRFVVTGAPRNDFLFRPDSRELLLKLLKQKEERQKFMIFMPTFRASEQKGGGSGDGNLFGFDSFDLGTFNSFLEEENFYLIVKSHPIFKRSFDELASRYSRIIVFPSDDLVEEWLDLYEVLGGTDLLLTDYSSVYFDYLLLDKPVVFLQNDLDAYSQERGFLLEPVEEWTPGPKVIDQEELQREISNYLKINERYRAERERVRSRVHTYLDNRSSERVWDFISSLRKV